MLARPEVAAERVEADASMIEQRFSELVDTCSRFSQDISHRAGWNESSPGGLDSVALNVEIARTVFGKWSLDILALLYLRQTAGFQELRKALGPISSRVLSSKLTRMQENGLVRRDVKPTRPPRVAYSLTDRGLTVAKLGEPVFLYLRISGAIEAREPSKESDPVNGV